MSDQGSQVGVLERLHWLKAFASFKDIPPADLSALAQRASEHFFPGGSAIFSAGERVSAIHLIVEGRVRIQRGGVPLGTREAGEGLGLLALLARSEENTEAIAETATLTLGFTGETFLDILEDHVSVLHHLLQNVCRLRIEQLEGTTHAITGAPETRSRATRTGELDLADRLLSLRRALPFAHGNIAALADLARHLKQVHFERGQVLWRLREEPAVVFLIPVAGQIAGRLASDDHLSFGPLTTPGMLECVAAIPRWFEASARTEVDALQLDGEHLLDVFDDNEEMAIEYLRLVAREALSSEA